jgi:hypothetical protein
MSARAIWKGSLKLGAEKVPVKLYSAVEDRSVHFHILEEKTLTRVKQQMVDPETGKPVDRADVQKGLEIEPGTFVVLHANELAGIEPEALRDIEITRLVGRSILSGTTAPISWGRMAANRPISRSRKPSNNPGRRALPGGSCGRSIMPGRCVRTGAILR